MATRVRNRPIMHCKPLSIEYVMYVYGLCLLFDFGTKNLHLATIFYHLVAKWRLNNFFLIWSPVIITDDKLSNCQFDWAFYCYLVSKYTTCVQHSLDKITKLQIYIFTLISNARNHWKYDSYNT